MFWLGTALNHRKAGDSHCRSGPKSLLALDSIAMDAMRGAGTDALKRSLEEALPAWTGWGAAGEWFVAEAGRWGDGSSLAQRKDEGIPALLA